MRNMGGVNRLEWKELDHGWRAGPYEIELAAPQLWVCTRRLRTGEVRIERTSGSLRALKAGIESHDFRRERQRRSLAFLGVLLGAIALAAVAMAGSWPLAPLLLVVFSAIGLFAALKAVDCLVDRAWESLRLHYQ